MFVAAAVPSVAAAPNRAAEAVASHQNEQQRILQGVCVLVSCPDSIHRLCFRPEFLNRKREAALNRARAEEDRPAAADHTKAVDSAVVAVAPSVDHVRHLSEVAQRKSSPAPRPDVATVSRCAFQAFPITDTCVFDRWTRRLKYNAKAASRIFRQHSPTTNGIAVKTDQLLRPPPSSLTW